MGILRELFGPSKEEVWQQLCREIGADYLEGGFWKGDKVQARVKDWIITLDTVSDGDGGAFTRMRAPFVNQDGFWFRVYRQGLLSELGKSLGLVEDVEVGDPDFDQNFILQGNDAAKVRALFANPRIRQLIQVQPAIRLEVKDDEGWFKAYFPEGVDELHFQVGGVIKDAGRLKNLFDLFAETLNQLGHLDSAYEDDVALFIEALRAPGGQIQDGPALLWDGDTPRRQAAQGLGRLKDPRAVEPLLQVLGDPDGLLRTHAIWALGEIGDARAVPALIPFLGEETEGGSDNKAAAAALRQLGEGRLVEAFAQTLRGSKAALESWPGKYRREVVQAFIRALDSPDAGPAVQSAEALAELGAVEALPALRAQSRVRHFGDERTEERWAQAVAQLEAWAALPRPADAPLSPETLPRPAGEPEPSPETLPRPIGEPESTEEVRLRRTEEE